MKELASNILKLLSSEGESDGEVGKGILIGLDDGKYMAIRDEYDRRRKEGQHFKVFVFDVFFFENIKRKLPI
jgi:hypothetical protein